MLLAELKPGAGWFYWIAGLTAVNTALTFSGSETSFALGFISSLVMDGMATENHVPQAAALVVDVVLIGASILFGVFASKGARWAFVLGFVLLLLDSLLLIPFFLGGSLPLMATLLHGWALYAIFKGMRTSFHLATVRAANPFTA